MKLDSMVNSIEVLDPFQTNFMKIVQNKLLPKRIDAVRKLILEDCHEIYRALVASAYIRYCMNIESHTVWIVQKMPAAIGREKC